VGAGEKKKRVENSRHGKRAAKGSRAAWRKDKDDRDPCEKTRKRGSVQAGEFLT